MNKRTELLKISEDLQCFNNIMSHLGDEYKSVLVLVTQQETGKNTFYFIKENHIRRGKTTFSCIKALENVIDYKYDNSRQILLANVETSNETGYWTAFSVYDVVFSHSEKDFSFDAFLKVDYSQEAPNAFFQQDFSYLPTARIVNIAGKNYIVKHSYWQELHDVKPLYYDRFLEIGPAGAIIYSSSKELKTLFGPFPSIVSFEDGEYPAYREQSSHGYLGKDENSNIVGLLITRDNASFDTTNYSNYNYRKFFDVPLKSLKFFKRDLEENDHVNKRYCARDIWKLTYPDGSKAVMFRTIGERELAFPTMFQYFIIKESETKEYFSD